MGGERAAEGLHACGACAVAHHEDYVAVCKLEGFLCAFGILQDSERKRFPSNFTHAPVPAQQRYGGAAFKKAACPVAGSICRRSTVESDSSADFTDSAPFIRRKAALVPNPAHKRRFSMEQVIRLSMAARPPLPIPSLSRKQWLPKASEKVLTLSPQTWLPLRAICCTPFSV